MLIAVASDAHGAQRRMDAMLDSLPPVHALCFLGDMEKDAEYLFWGLREKQPGATFYSVVGNNDPQTFKAATIEVVFGGVRTLLTHGHLFDCIRTSRHALARHANSRDLRLALYGHTHRQLRETVGSALLVNPGALQDGQWALVEIADGVISVRMQSL